MRRVPSWANSAGVRAGALAEAWAWISRVTRAATGRLVERTSVHMAADCRYRFGKTAQEEARRLGGGCGVAEIVSLAEAIGRAVHDGDTVAMEGFTHLIPHAAGREVIRQGRRGLTLVRMTPDVSYDQV